MKYILPLLLLLLASSFANANLGETEAQLEIRYGKPFATGKVEKQRAVKNTYHVNGKDVAVTLQDGKSVCEEYSTVADDKTVKAILDANKGQYSWFEFISGGSTRKFPIRNWQLGTRGDAHATASYSGGRLVTKELVDTFAVATYSQEKLFIATWDFYQQINAAAEANDSSKP